MEQAPLDAEVAIETPEHIVFQYRIAGPARRAIAQVIDLVLCYGAIAAVATLAVLASSTTMSDFGASVKAGIGFLLVALFLAQWMYFAIWEATLGRSPGKMVVGVRVLTTAGRPIGWREAILRNWLRAADLLPVAYLTGVVAMAFGSRFQRLGDLVAGTIVVIPERASAARPIELAPPAHPRELAELPDTIALDADERSAIELFLRRRHALGVAREQELALIVATPLGERLGYSHPDPSRLLALVYDRAVNAGRTEAPPSSLFPGGAR